MQYIEDYFRETQRDNPRLAIYIDNNEFTITIHDNDGEIAVVFGNSLQIALDSINQQCEDIMDEWSE